MKNLQVGMVVCYEGKFYLYGTGSRLGEYRLIPIMMDDSRQSLPVTPEMELSFRRVVVG